MNDKLDSKKTKMKPAAETPVHTLRHGGVGASIWRRQSPAGYVYYDYSLTRSWKSLSSGSTGYSKNFFTRNRDELVHVIDEATRWIAAHEAGEKATQAIAA